MDGQRYEGEAAAAKIEATSTLQENDRVDEEDSEAMGNIRISGGSVVE